MGIGSAETGRASKISLIELTDIKLMFFFEKHTLLYEYELNIDL